MSAGLLLLLALLGLLISALASVGVRVVRDFSRHELEEICQRRNQMDRFGEILDLDEEVAEGVAMLQVFGTAVWIVSTAFWWTSKSSDPTTTSLTTWLAVVGISGLTLAVTYVWIPRAMMRLWAEPFLLATWPFWRLARPMAAPFSVGAWCVNTVLFRLAGKQADHEEDEEEAFEDEIRSMVTEGMHEGLIEADAGEMIDGVMELGDATVSEIMTPRSDIVAMPDDISWDEVLRFVNRCRRTRIPVYHKQLDNIVGVLYAKDLLNSLTEGAAPRPTAVELARKPVWFIPKTKPLDDLLQEFQDSRNHMAIVVDEYQAVAGIVTIEDVLEEIVGEIVDEYDKVEEAEASRQLGNHSWEAEGRVQLAELNEKYALKLPEEEEYDTIAGLVINQLGHIPKAGEVVHWEGYDITVLEATRRKVERVRLDQRNPRAKTSA